MEWCQNCPLCSSRKQPLPKARAPLQSVKTGYPQQIVAMDILGPFPESQEGNKYILVVSDYFTTWVEAYALKNQETTTVANKLVDEFFVRFGPPEQLHSDQGCNFEAEVVQEICKLLEIVKTRTSPDGLVERMNRTLLDMLCDQQSCWDSHLIYNTSVQPTTGYSPFFLMFGRQVKMPVDLMYGSENQVEPTITTQ